MGKRPRRSALPQKRGMLAIEPGLWILAFALLAFGWGAVLWAPSVDDNPGDPLMPLWFAVAMLVLLPGTLFFALSGAVRVVVLLQSRRTKEGFCEGRKQRGESKCDAPL